MKKNKIFIVLILVVVLFTTLCSCTVDRIKKENKNALDVGGKFTETQPLPTDINYSLERYNLIRRAYWVNGQREKAVNLPCSITKPLGYVILITSSGAILGRFIVDGKVTCLNTYLVPESEYYEDTNNSGNQWLPDVDGCYGSNIDGIFFFTPDGKYMEWTGTYLYSDIPFTVDDPILGVN